MKLEYVMSGKLCFDCRSNTA